MHARHQATALAFSKVGATPTENLGYYVQDLPPVGPGHVQIEMIAAPINPQDLMVLLGKYPVKPAHHVDGSMVPGFDGVCRVIAVGEGVNHLEVNDLAIPSRHGLGTWRSHAVVSGDFLLKVSAQADPRVAAILRMGVAPAYLLLEDMATLRPGDFVIQNAASGVIAQMVIQFARLRGLHTISIVRDRDDQEGSTTIQKTLLDMGSHKSLVINESELASTANFGERRVMLALDAVFGQAGAQLARVASPGATLVNYGSLGADAMHGMILTQQAIFWNQVSFKNFRLSQCLAQRTAAQIDDLLMWFISLVEEGKLKAPSMASIQWSTEGRDPEESLVEAVKRAQSHEVGGAKKQLFLF